jgi:hypothetical protein
LVSVMIVRGLILKTHQHTKLNVPAGTVMKKLSISV